jgi:hypothetical protein
VVDVKLTVVQGQLGVLDRGSVVWCLEADESKWRLSVLCVEQLERLDFTVSTKEGSEIFLSSGSIEALHIQVASLLRVLIFKSLMSKLLGTLRLLKSWLNVELLTIDFFTIHGFNSGGSALWSILTVLSITTIANKSVFSNIVLLQEEGRNLTVGTESFFDIFLTPGLGNVLYEDVVEDFAEVGLGLWFKLDSNELIASTLLSKSLGSVLWVLEANETVATRGVVFVERDFRGDDTSILGEHFLEALRVDGLWDLANENVLGAQAADVHTSELS